MPGARLHRPGGTAGAARIAVDLLGGDHAPAVVVDGALRACGADPDLHLLLVGPSEVAEEVRRALPPGGRDRVTVRVALGAVGMADAPVRAKRPDTTVHAAVAAAVAGHADGVISAGASGATVTAAVLGFGRLPDVRRPALAASLPAVNGPVVLLDVGGSIEASPATLVRHAALGVAYARVRHGVRAPRVGLLSIGTEPGKGDRARRVAELMLRQADLPAGGVFAGLVEGDEVTAGGRADVVVTDGFTGNILLKGVEGAYALAGGESVVPHAAALLGIPGTVVICHGAATGRDIAAGIGLAALLSRGGAPAELADLVAVPPGGGTHG